MKKHKVIETGQKYEPAEVCPSAIKLALVLVLV